MKWMQFRDGSRKPTNEWLWSKAEEVAKRKAAQMAGIADTASVAKTEAYPVEKAVDEWIAEREADGIRNNTKAKFIGAKLLAWCNRNDIRFLHQIQKQALRIWRTEEWKYRTGDSTSLKVHWSVLRSFFAWCVEGDLLEGSPCPKRKGKIKQREVVPLTAKQLYALEDAAMKMRSPGWTEVRRLQMRALILLMRWSGMAIADAVCLERHPDGERRLIGQVIHGKRFKTDKNFSVPIPTWLVELLKALPVTHPKYLFWRKRRSDGTELKQNSIITTYGDWFTDIFRLAGIKDGHSHQLRHSFATHHLSNGVPVERVAEWMGDSVAEVLRTYGHWCPKRQEQSEQAMRASWAAMGLDEMGNPVGSVQ